MNIPKLRINLELCHKIEGEGTDNVINDVKNEFSQYVLFNIEVQKKLDILDEVACDGEIIDTVTALNQMVYN